MFDIGFWELLLISIIALVVIGPERLPSAAAKVGKIIGQVRRTWMGVKNEFMREAQTEELRRQIAEQKAKIESLQTPSLERVMDLDNVTDQYKTEEQLEQPSESQESQAPRVEAAENVTPEVVSASESLNIQSPSSDSQK